MVMKVNQALSAYARTAATGAMPGMEARDAGPSFASMVKEAAKNTVDQLHQGEQLSAKAVIGKADLTEVVTAVTNAEVALQAATAVRDKMISAYQEILRMPI
jgi:flagellar hook-basal body complex protein FliE